MFDWDEQNRRRRRRVERLVFLVFILGALIPLGVAFSIDWPFYVKQNQWPAAEAQILSGETDGVRLNGSKGSNDTGYQPTYTVAFEVSGQHRQAVVAGEPQDDEQSANASVQALIARKTVRIRYRPDDPSDAMLESGWPGDYILGTGLLTLMSFVFILIPVLVQRSSRS